MKIIYKCVLCNDKIIDRNKMRRLSVQKWNTKYYGRFILDKKFDLCNKCYFKLLKEMEKIKNEGKI